MGYLPYTLTCRRISEICIWSSSQRRHVIPSEKIKLDQDKYISGFFLSLCGVVIQKSTYWGSALGPSNYNIQV